MNEQSVMQPIQYIWRELGVIMVDIDIGLFVHLVEINVVSCI